MKYSSGLSWLSGRAVPMKKRTTARRSPAFRLNGTDFKGGWAQCTSTSLMAGSMTVFTVA